MTQVCKKISLKKYIKYSSVLLIVAIIAFLFYLGLCKFLNSAYPDLLKRVFSVNQSGAPGRELYIALAALTITLYIQTKSIAVVVVSTIMSLTLTYL